MVRISRKRKRNSFVGVFFKKKRQGTSSAQVVGFYSSKRNNSSANIRKRKLLFLWLRKFIKLLLLLIVGLFIGVVIILTMLSVVVSLKTGKKVNYFNNIFSSVKNLTIVKRFLPADNNNNLNKDVKFVTGIPDVPVYPGSTFVFDNIIKDINNPDFLDNPPKGFTKQEMFEIYRFLTDNNSVYFMPLESTWQDVVSFYKEELPKYGWTHVLTVNVDDLSKVEGEYFVKGDKGLHIYTIKYDIWYEIITKEQALNGLEDVVYSYKKQLIKVRSNLGLSLPDGVFWTLKYSSDWELTLSKDKKLRVPVLVFSKGKQVLTIEPVDYIKKPLADLEYNDLIIQANDFLKDNYKYIGITEDDLESVEFVKFVTNDVKGIKVKVPNKKVYIAFIPNKVNTILYCFYYQGEDPSFFEYVLDEIKASK